jgi:FHA domain
VLVPGKSQRQIARTLNAAYATGLLSEETFVARTTQLVRGGVIDRARLVGDLNLRPARKAWLVDVAAAFARAITRVTASTEIDQRRPRTLLALDWSGTQTEMLIGRDHHCDVLLGDLSVSRRHARLLFRDGGWILQDLDSTNGTRVNGSRVGRCALRPGDDIALGDEHLTID